MIIRCNHKLHCAATDFLLYNNQINAWALIGQSAVGYCCAFLKIEFKLLSSTRKWDTHNFLHFSSFHPDLCKRAIPYSQFLRLHRLCSDDDDFLAKSREMMTFFTQRGYPLTSLEQDLCRVTAIQ